MRRFAAFVAPTLTALLFSVSASAVEISLSCGAVGAELTHCQAGADAWAKATGHTVKIVSTPNSATERLALYQQILASGSSDIDVFQIDVIWPGILVNYMIDLTPYAKQETLQHFVSIVANNTVNNKLVAMPWFTDAGLLYYRKDLLEKYGTKVPTTWADLASVAEKIQAGERKAGNDKMWGFVFQGKAYEGLTCNALEWVDSFGGGTFMDDAGKITVNNPHAIEALKTVAGWVGSITPEGVLGYAEEEARGIWQSGNAVFMRNWPYAWALGQAADSPIKNKIGVAALPKGGANGKYSGALGGWQLSVSKFSKNQAVAADLVMYLTSDAEQKRRALVGGYNPTRPALYQDKEILAANPFFDSLYETFTNAAARPAKATGAKYNRVSNEIWNATHAVLSKKETAEKAVPALEAALVRAMR
ncbi:putative ABC transporter-binding protein [Elstera cyanobacteriorum]|uniref:ABC transporter substrate-binding protein n=1 Tax=Elstera cyanobacteriorum TaxID=2022747 RepID=A0A255XXN5_9PROT|nr:ABC transporter substrate-binding protein [Elstera cyanobacteriorum]OYQ21769.1 ABC transporter substrate-binding protein [Elstera cyanobacteriorum]GGA01023.1 putative ABC transporter-binding protein [Elstera cyanobacteriorum]